ncbi:MAG: hypothetical protein ABIB43_05495 [archaeon]
MEEMTLKQWTIFFVKNKDILKNSLQGYEDKENPLVFKFSDKIHKYLVLDALDDSVFPFIKESDFKSVVCKAKNENLKFLIDNWNSFKDVEYLDFVFADVVSNKRWIINPKIHSRICDEDSLVLGLKTMYDNSF